MSIQHINDCIEQAVEVVPEAPKPLRRKIAKANPFPVEVLPLPIKNAVLAIHDKIQAPIAICAQSVLSTVTLAVQALADVELPIGTVKPISNNYFSVAATGERKTSCDSLALVPIKQYEQKLAQAYKNEKQAWDAKHAAWQAQQNQILRDKGKYASQQEKEAALSALIPPPPMPLLPLLTCPEPTYEGLCRYLIHGQPSVGIFSAEGGQFIGGHGMKDENKLKTAAALSELWDGTEIKRVRAGDGTTILPGRRVSMHLMVQPKVASTFLSDRVLSDQGLLSRLLVVSPETTSGTRFYKEPQIDSDEKLRTFNDLIESILDIPLSVREGTTNELVPRVILLALPAKEAWIHYVDQTERELKPGGKYEPIKGLANKLPEHAIRLAANFTLVEDPFSSNIPLEKMQMGIVLANYYAEEALRLFDEGSVDPKLLLAERLLEWLHNNWPEKMISLPDIYQRSLNRVNSKKVAQELVSILEDHEWLVKVEAGGEIDGQFRRDVWRIVNKL